MNSEENRIKISIADPQYLTNKALEIILSEKYEILGTINEKTELIYQLEINPVSLLILDAALFELNKPIDLKNLLQKVPKILIITNSLSQSEFNELTEAGIENIILKTADNYEIMQAIEATLKGRKFYSEGILEMLIEKSYKKTLPVDSANITLAEMEIVKMISHGMSTKQIATQKFISVHTVITHKKNIFRKTGVNSISELILHAIKAGWVDNIEYYI
jgi:DNA-binding NarL/FixJ family response regulator